MNSSLHVALSTTGTGYAYENLDQQLPPLEIGGRKLVGVVVSESSSCSRRSRRGRGLLLVYSTRLAPGAEHASYCPSHVTGCRWQDGVRPAADGRCAYTSRSPRPRRLRPRVRTEDSEHYNANQLPAANFERRKLLVRDFS